MNELKVTKILKNDLGFSNSSIEKIKKFNNYLLKYNKSYNLISKSTENNIWHRHILDSAQIIKFIDFSFLITEFSFTNPPILIFLLIAKLFLLEIVSLKS